METIKLYRRRYIPDELIFLKDDEIVYFDEERIVTRWTTLKPRKDFTHGVSCYFLNRGFKVSKFIDANDNILFWYCDIISCEHDAAANAYLFHDLLIDIVVYADGFVKVLDMEELATALDEGQIDIGKAKEALRRASELLAIVYDKKFHTLSHFLEF